jgi:phenylalanyl-tRNA synthetase beta chain
VAFSYTNCQELIGKNIDRGIVKNIIIALGIEITSEGTDGLLLNVPRFKTDVTREADVVEEVLRIYGYNNVESSTHFNFSVQKENASYSHELENTITALLSGNGFSEIMSLSLSKESLYQENSALVNVVNPLSQDLNVLRGNMLYSGLEAVRYNINYKNSDLKFFEFGKTYSKESNSDFPYSEQKHLSLFITGNKISENPYSKVQPVDFAYLKAVVESVLKRLGISNFSAAETGHQGLAYGLDYSVKKKNLVQLGLVNKSTLKKFDIAQPVFYADFDFALLLELQRKQSIHFSEIPKFPSVRRDLAMLLDKGVKYQQIKDLAFAAERKFLKEVNLFDIYEGDKIADGKKSYAVSYTLLNEESTLTDKQIDSIMQKLITTYKEKLGAELR